MAENTAGSCGEEKSGFRTAFQWAAALVAPFGCEAPNAAYNNAGNAWDYAKAWVGAHRKPKLT